MSLALNKDELKCLIEILMLSNLIVAESGNPKNFANKADDQDLGEKRFEILALTQKIYQYASKNGLSNLFENDNGLLNVDDDQISFGEDSIFAMFGDLIDAAMMSRLAEELSIRNYLSKHGADAPTDNEAAWAEIEAQKTVYLQNFEEHRFSNLYLAEATK